MSRLAAIDVGTNSVLLLIAEKKDGEIIALRDEAHITRIGEGVGKTHRFNEHAMDRTLAILKKYKKICDELGVQKIVTVGTAAFRKAANAAEFLERAKLECGFAIEIISGEKEAALTWEAASTDFGSDIMVVDIGGGSTEIITPGLHAVSLPVGSVVLTEKFCHTDPISQPDFKNICDCIDSYLSSLKALPANAQLTLVATAGTATTLGAIQKKLKKYLHAEVHGSQLTLNNVGKILTELKSKTVEERKKIPGLDPARADVILAGAILLQKIARHFGFNSITISDRGVRWGLIYQILKSDKIAGADFQAKGI